jgi:hypothetical protein
MELELLDQQQQQQQQQQPTTSGFSVMDASAFDAGSGASPRPENYIRSSPTPLRNDGMRIRSRSLHQLEQPVERSDAPSWDIALAKAMWHSEPGFGASSNWVPEVDALRIVRYRKRRWVWAVQFACAMWTLASVVDGNYATRGFVGAVKDHNAVDASVAAGATLFGLIVVVDVHELCKLCHPTDGLMHKLRRLYGDSGDVQIYRIEHQRLRRGAIGLKVLGVASVLYLCIASLPVAWGMAKKDLIGPFGGKVKPGLYKLRWANSLNCIMSIMYTSYVSTVAWTIWAILKLATSLVNTQINELRFLTTAASPSETDWETIERRAIRIATDVVPAFSDAFSVLMVQSILAINALWITQVPYLVNPARLPIEQAGGVAFAVASCVCSLFILLDPASVTTVCERFRDEVNMKRVTDDGKIVPLSISRRIEVLENFMKGLNKGHGMGYSFLGAIVDKRLVKKILITIATASASIGPILLNSLRELRSADASATCTLSQEDETIIRAIFDANQTCAFDILSNGHEVLSTVPSNSGH